ncbi:MAG: hypothetical protein WD801_11420 [Gemmatimonadaceae bacterium]
MELAQRRIVSRIVRVGLIVLAFGLVAGWLMRRVTHDGRVTVTMDAPAVTALGPGDMQLFNVDSTVDLILLGDQITAGLSPQTVAKVRGQLAQSAEGETTGLGGSIARMVKETVADKIGTRVVYSVHDMREIRYDNGRLVVQWKDSRRDEPLLGSIKVDGDKDSNRFREAEAQAFVEAVRARQRP